VGVVDADYRGNVIVAIYNDSDEYQDINKGDRIAQLIIIPYCTNPLMEVDEITETERGSGGFGSTGTN
jgi:dUTP pyrophosphatase